MNLVSVNVEFRIKILLNLLENDFLLIQLKIAIEQLLITILVKKQEFPVEIVVFSPSVF